MLSILISVHVGELVYLAREMQIGRQAYPSKLPHHLDNFTRSKLVKLDTATQKISKHETPTKDYRNRIYIVSVIDKSHIDLARFSLEEAIQKIQKTTPTKTTPAIALTDTTESNKARKLAKIVYLT